MECIHCDLWKRREDYLGNKLSIGSCLCNLFKGHYGSSMVTSINTRCSIGKEFDKRNRKMLQFRSILGLRV